MPEQKEIRNLSPGETVRVVIFPETCIEENDGDGRGPLYYEITHTGWTVEVKCNRNSIAIRPKDNSTVVVAI